MRLSDRDLRLAALERDHTRRDISIHTPEDIRFVQELVDQVSEWLKVVFSLDWCPELGVCKLCFGVSN